MTLLEMTNLMDYSSFGNRYSRSLGKRVLCKRKVPKTYGYVRRLLDDMVDRRYRVTLASAPGLADTDPRVGHGYANPTRPLSQEEMETLLATYRSHSRFVAD